jgi:hypothetical protein
MITQYDDLIAACEAHDSCREEASSTGAVKDLQRWHGQWPVETKKNSLFDLQDSELLRCILPLVGWY